MNNAVNQLHVGANELAKMGPLALAMTDELWSQFSNVFDQVDVDALMCEVVLGQYCECGEGRSGLVTQLSGADPGVELTCVPRLAGFFNRLNFNNAGGSETATLGSFSQRGGVGATYSLQRENLVGWENITGCGSTESALELEASIEFVPRYTTRISDRTFYLELQGTVTAEASVLIESDYSTDAGDDSACQMTKSYVYPPVPKTHTQCIVIPYMPPVCITFGIQGIANITASGRITGDMQATGAAEYEVTGTITVDLESGEVDVDVHEGTPQVTSELTAVVSASAQVDMDLGPSLLFYPMPGLPVTVIPTARVTARASGTIHTHTDRVHPPEPGLLNPLDRHREYSSVFDHDPVGQGHGQGMIDSPQAWSANHAEHQAGEWMEMDLESPVLVRGVVTQGRQDLAQWVTRISVQHSLDGQDR